VAALRRSGAEGAAAAAAEEEVGFDDSTTENEISGLIDFTASLLPETSPRTSQSASTRTAGQR
jgi:hypothetical protein